MRFAARPWCWQPVSRNASQSPVTAPVLVPLPEVTVHRRKSPIGIRHGHTVGAAQHANTYSAFNMNVKPPEYDVPDVKFPGPTEQYFRQPQELMVNLKAQRFTTEEVIHAMEDGASAIAPSPAVLSSLSLIRISTNTGNSGAGAATSTNTAARGSL